MSFSGAVRITDIQDYITPSQACVKPVPSPVVAKNAAGGAAGGAARVRLEIGEDDDGTRTYGEKNLDTGVVREKTAAKAPWEGAMFENQADAVRDAAMPRIDSLCSLPPLNPSRSALFR